MNAREVMEYEALFSGMERGVSRRIAQCIVRLAGFGRLTREDHLRFNAERSCDDGIIKLMYRRRFGRTVVPELLRVVASPNEPAERVYNAARTLAPIVSRYLVAADNEPAVRAQRDCIPPPANAPSAKKKAAAPAPQPSL